MRRTILGLAVLLAVIAPATAAANTAHWRTPPRMPRPTVFIVYAACPDGTDDPCADAEQHTVYIPDPTDRFELMHEIGHVYLENLDGYWKGAIMAHLGFDPAVDSWDDRPAELAADAYAACALRFTIDQRHGDHVTGHWESAYDYYPSRRGFRRMCQLIVRSGRS